MSKKWETEEILADITNDGDELVFDEMLNIGMMNSRKDGRLTIDKDFLAYSLQEKFDFYIEKHLTRGLDNGKRHPEDALLRIEKKILRWYKKQIEGLWQANGYRGLAWRITLDYISCILETEMWKEDMRISDAMTEAASLSDDYYSKTFFQTLKKLLAKQRENKGK